eukprot:1159894-Pelagomonas_calceolata.AAC.5
MHIHVLCSCTYCHVRQASFEVKLSSLVLMGLPLSAAQDGGIFTPVGLAGFVSIHCISHFLRKIVNHAAYAYGNVGRY